MKTVNVQRDELLTTLQQNRERHIENHAIATEERQKDVLETLKNLLEALEADPAHPVRENLRFPVVENHEAEYDRAIKMVEMSVDEVLELDQQQFNQLVMDRWQWQQDFMQSATLYAAGKLK